MCVGHYLRKMWNVYVTLSKEDVECVCGTI